MQKLVGALSAIPVTTEETSLPQQEQQQQMDREEIRKAEIQRRMGKALEENQQILVLGAASHVGSHIVRKFIETVPNSQITICDTKDPNLAFEMPEMRQYKGTSRVTVQQTSPYDWDWLSDHQSDYNVIVVAPMLHDAVYCHNNPVDSIYRNGVFATNFMTALTKGSGWTSDGKLIILSTDKVYGHQEKMPIPETAPLHPVGVRAVTRCAQEFLMTGLAKASGIHYIVLRLGTTYGPYMPREKAIQTWVRSALMNVPIRMFGSFAKNDSPSRDFIHIDDVSALVGFTAISEWPTHMRDEIYNVGKGDSQPRYLWNVAEAVKTTIRRGLNTVMEGWRDPGERNLRCWLDMTKTGEKLCFLPSTEFLWGALRILPVWIAFFELLWSEPEIIDLKKRLGMRDQVEAKNPSATK